MAEDDEFGSPFGGSFSKPFQSPFPTPAITNYLLREDGSRFLREDSGFILRE